MNIIHLATIASHNFYLRVDSEAARLDYVKEHVDYPNNYCSSSKGELEAALRADKLQKMYRHALLFSEAAGVEFREHPILPLTAEGQSFKEWCEYYNL